MDGCSTKNNSLSRKLKFSSKQVEKSSKKLNSSIELLSIDENNFNTEDKLNLPTKNQRLKEYFITNTSDKNLLSGQPPKLNINLIGTVPKNDGYKKPVKVKSRWTRTSQMELALENYSSLQTKKNNPSINNLPQSPDTINTVLGMAVTPEKKENKQNKAKNSVGKSVVVNNRNINSENIVAMKKKRGRPKKIVIENKDETPVIFNNDNEDKKVIMVKSNKSTDIKPVDNDTPTVLKRGRGRPKKSDTTPDIVLTPTIVSNITTPKTRGRKKLGVTKVNKNHTKGKSKASSNTKRSKINLKVNADFSNNDNSTSSSDSEVDESLFLDTLSIQLVRCDSSFSSNQEKGECLNRTHTETIQSSCNNEQYVFDFNKVNWNIIPNNMGSKSVQEESTKIRHRRNSLSSNFTFASLNSLKIQNDDFKLKKSWKSLSYLEGGPNIQIERYQQKELDKKYRSRLKRSRSFPECIQLDTVVWRYLCYQQTYEINDCFEEISDYEMNLINELPEYGYNPHYRSKSVPIEKCEYNEMGKITYKCKSLTDLNTLDFTNDFKTSFQISSSGCDAINSESDCKGREGKIRRSKRLNTKVKTNDFLEEVFLLEFSKSSCNYLQVAEEIRRENEKQLEEAKKNDPELEKKLNKLNFTLVTDNIFRPNRKKMSEYTPAEAIELRKLKLRRPIIGDTYSCNCKYSKQDWSEGKPGCGPECINRLLNIECGSGCLLMSACSNKQFQNKQFKRTQIVRTANKGYGVFALEDIPSGTFVDEYMGEVIDQHEMIKRMKKKLYMNNNYMVQLNHDEIIDATRKGNITRFINHSCEPNCVAEKWNVLGESRMGFFSKQQIHKGEEITFDYSFEIFGDTAQQKCYCGTPKCRGFISKKSKTGYLSSSSDESDDAEDTLVIKPDEQEKKKKKKIIKKITYKDKKRLQELDQQLTDISRIKNKNRSDLENSTLNLNKLMVHITDSMSRSHILKFIRENDLNCKKLFMNFNGLSIIHSWMISSNNESLKLEIIKTLSVLPISNRNTITKSKVIDIVADWAKIPSNIKEAIEDLKYPETKSTEHSYEVEKLLPNEKNISQLAQEARVLWKKWIILRMVFKIPKLDRPKEVQIPNIICKPPIILPSTKRKLDQYHFGKPMIPNQPSNINYEHIKNKFKHVKNEPSKGTPENLKNKTNSIETFSKMINHHNQKNNLYKYKAVLEWNKKQIQHTENTLKTNNIYKVDSSVKIQNSSPLVLNSKRDPTLRFKAKIQHQEIPTIETTTISKNMKRNNIPEFKPAVYEVPTDDSVQSVPANKIIDETVYYPIETVHLELPPPTFSEINDQSILTAMFQVAPPKFSEKWSTLFKVTDDVTFGKSSSTIAPDGMSYDELHPSVEEQYEFMSSQSSIQNPNHTLIDTSYTEPTITESSNSNIEIVEQPLSEEVRNKLFKQCEDNLKKLKDKGILDVLKSAKKNHIDQSPMKIPASLFEKKLSLSFLQRKNDKNQLKFLKNLKIASNCYREQPSRLIKLNKLEAKNKLPQNKNDIFRIKEKQTVKCDTASLALKLCNEQLSAVPQSLNIRKLLTEKSVKIKTENKFACKILNGCMKKFSAMPDKFIIKLPRDSKITVLDPAKELDLYHKLTPTVNNKLCAKLINEDNKDTVNVFKQKITMKYDETKPIRLESITKESSVFLKNFEESIIIPKAAPKRKLPLPPMENVKPRKISNSSMENIDLNELGGENYVTITNQLKDSEIFKKPLPPIHHKIHRNKYFNIETTTDSQLRNPKTSSPIKPSVAQRKKKVDEFRQKPSTSSAEIKIDENEIRQKPLMKCLPFNKVGNISATELEQNLKVLATSLSMSYPTDLLPSTSPKSELIKPIVESFKNSVILNNPKSLNKDDSILLEFIKNNSLPEELKVRKYKLPESMMSLPIETLNLVPDNPKDIKIVVDFYHSMATVIVKVLDSYAKKSCKQGRLKNHEDFKYLAKKLNSNILYKELQVKKVEDLRISESVKQKVGQFIKTYMCKYGKVYRRKSTDT